MEVGNQQIFFVIFMICFVTDDRPSPKLAEKCFAPNASTSREPFNTDLIPQPTVTIMVESPQDAPNSQNDFTMNVDISSAADSSIVIDIDEPIDVNVPRDTSNIFYEYPDDVSTNLSQSNEVFGGAGNETDSTAAASSETPPDSNS